MLAKVAGSLGRVPFETHAIIAFARENLDPKSRYQKLTPELPRTAAEVGEGPNYCWLPIWISGL